MKIPEKKLTVPVLMVGPAPDGIDIFYLTGFRAPDLYFMLRCSGKWVLLVSSMEQSRAQQCCPHAEVLTFRDFSNGRSRSIQQAVSGLLKMQQIRRVALNREAPVYLFRYMNRHGIKPVMAGRSGRIDRRRKTPEEQAHIRQCQQAAAAAMQRVHNLLKKSKATTGGFLKQAGRRLTSEDLKIAVQRELIEHNCYAEDIIAACGPDSARPHETGRGLLRVSEPIILDIFPRHMETGYWGDITRTFAKGPIPDGLKDMYAAVLEAQQTGLQALKPRRKTSSIHREVIRVFEEHGYETEMLNGRMQGFIHGTGHGVGLEIHEAPRLSYNADFLAAGQVVTVEPGLYYDAIGGVRIEDTVCITTDGFEMLASFHKRLEV